MKLYQIKNSKSGRKIKHTDKGYKWGCDCGGDGSYFSLDEALEVANKLNFYLDVQGFGGEAILIEFDAEKVIIKKKAKRNIDDDDDGF